MVALVGWRDGSLRVRLPALSDETDAVQSAAAKRAAPERCSRPMIPWSTATEDQAAAAPAPQDQYAGGILSLSESESLFLFCGKIPMKAGGGEARLVFHSAGDLPTAR